MTTITTGPNSPTAAINSPQEPSLQDWDSPSNALISDDLYASVSGGAIASDYLILTGFGFNIPSDAIILAIFPEVECHRGAIPFQTVRVYLTKDGSNITSSGSNGYISFVQNSQTDSIKIGSPTSRSLFDTTWTASEINSSTFGCVIQSTSLVQASMYIDYVRLSVDYVLNNPRKVFSPAARIFDFAAKTRKFIFNTKTR